MHRCGRGSSRAMTQWLKSRCGAVAMVLVYVVLAALAMTVIWSGVLGVKDMRFIRVIDIARQAEVLYRESNALADSLHRAAGGDAVANYRERRARVVLRLNAVAASVADLEINGLIPAAVAERLNRLELALDTIPRELPSEDDARADLEPIAEALTARAIYFGGDVQQELHQTMATQTRILSGYATWVGVLSVIVAFAGLALLLMLIALHRKNGALQRLATEDPLTGLPNRRTALERGRSLVGLARRLQQPLSVVVLDLDRFKAINDRYGHPAGDSVIAQAGRTMAAEVRGSDVLARIGGEEFMLVLPDTDAAGARAISEKLLAALARTHVQCGADRIPVTASAGIASGHGTSLDLDALYAEADRGMYAAKNTGRNRITVRSAGG